MIEMTVRLEDGGEIARIRITRQVKYNREYEPWSDYLAEIAVDRAGIESAIGLYRVVVRDFPRARYNVLGLIKAVLDQLEGDRLELDPTSPSDLARRLRRSLPAF